MIDRIRVVMTKELVDNLRDRRTLTSALLYPLLGPLLLVGLFFALGRQASVEAEQRLRLPVVGGENAPALVAYLRQNNVDILPGPDAPEDEVRAGDLDIVLVIPPSYAEDFKAGRPATVRLVSDASRTTGQVTVQRARRLIEGYNGQMGALRLLARGVNPGVVSALAIENVDVSTPQSQAAFLLNMLPYFLILSLFLGSMALSIDTTAGERERGSLEPLLINPIRRAELVLGKLSASLLFTLVVLVESLVTFALVLNLTPLERVLGLRLSLDPATLVGIGLICLPITLLAVGVQMIVATLAGSFKEAQNYLSFVALVPALPGAFLSFVPVKPALWNMLIPTFGQQILMIRVLRGEAITPEDALVSALATIALALALVFVAVWLYQGERIVRGK